MDACEEHFSKSMATKSVFNILQLAIKNNAENLKVKCLDFIADNALQIDDDQLELLDSKLVIKAFKHLAARGTKRPANDS